MSECTSVSVTDPCPSADPPTDCDQWLCSVLGVATAPAHETDSYSDALLQRLAAHCSRADTHARTLCRQYESQCAAYAAERARLQQLQRSLGVSGEQLSQQARRQLQLLAQLAVQLQLSAPLTPATVSTELLRWRIHCDQMTQRHQLQQQQLEQPLLGQLEQLAAAGDQCDRQLAEAEREAVARAAVSAKRRDECRFLGDKVRQYERQCSRLQRRLEAHTSAAGVPTHQQLQQQLQLCTDLEGQLEQVQLLLQPYCQLPASPRRASVRVADLEAQLEQLELQINARANSLADH